MMDFYYQIKARLNEPTEGVFGIQNWSHPPVFVGKVTAADKNEAKRLVEIDYGRVFPLRVLKKDLESQEFLMQMEEMKPGSHYHSLFQMHTCKNTECNKTFYPIDKYNDTHYKDKSFDVCSFECRQVLRNTHSQAKAYYLESGGASQPIIYKITNKQSGMIYIGKTTQVFTLRWYQHFFHPGNNKFHTAISNSKVTDWNFEVQEIVIIPEEIKDRKGIENYITERERHWIEYYNSKEVGYNSM